MKKIKDIMWIAVIQMMAGSILIYALDKLFAMLGNDTYVGINVLTLGFTGIMGVPGVIVLFSLAFILKSA